MEAAVAVIDVLVIVVLVLFGLLVAWAVIVTVRDTPVPSDYQAHQHRISGSTRSLHTSPSRVSAYPAQQHSISGVRTPNPDLRERLWRQMPKLDDGRGVCPGCLRGKHFEDFHLDHIVPKTKGGADADDNIQLLCHNCNVTKGSGTMDELDARLARRGLQPSRERRREVSEIVESAARPKSDRLNEWLGRVREVSEMVESAARQQPRQHATTTPTSDSGHSVEDVARTRNGRGCQAGQHLWKALLSPSAPAPILTFCHDVVVDADDGRFGGCRWHEKGHLGHVCYNCGARVTDKRHQ